MFGSFGTMEIIIVVGIIVVLFIVPSRLPKMGRDLGAGLREFRNIRHAGKEAASEVNKALRDE